jgi:CO/xanthine dehydrogenase FAD-binding subunit/aerobic-type carbon monoxide dehydrogenase small subunit (CoxS/CutS family)
VPSCAGMTLAGFRYCRPATVADAAGLLRSEPGSVALAGGQSLLASMVLRRAQPALVVDLEGLDSELGGIRMRDGALEIGALARQQDLLTDPLVREHAPLLAEAARLVANPQVRARGTVGGALAHRDPPAEIPAALAALGARLTIRGPDAERTVALAGEGAGLDLEPGELVAAVTVPAAPAASGWAFEEVAPRFAARPLVAVAAVARAGGARLAVAGVTAAPAVLELEPGEVGDAALEDRLAALPPVADPRASLDYRRRAAAALGARSLRRAAAGPPPGPPVPVSGAPTGRTPRALAPTDAADVAVEVNGDRHELSTPVNRSLAELIRDDLGLTATHLGCEHGVCGSCNVLVDGAAVRSCLMLAAQADGRAVETVEGLRDRGALQRLVQAFVDQRALQCGFCTPGMLVTLAGLAEAPADRRGLREQLVGNLCRCTGYRPILEAAEAAL